MPPDPVRLRVDDERLRHNVLLLAEGHHTMVRVPGNTVYEDERFLDLLDELGLMLWQDCMLAYVDVPDDPAVVAGVSAELTQVFTALQGRPCLALVCGGADTEEQAQYQGLDAERWVSSVADTIVPGLLAELLPGTAYLRSTPGASPLPTTVDTGVAHYFGVPGYARPLSDVRAGRCPVRRRVPARRHPARALRARGPPVGPARLGVLPRPPRGGAP